MLVWSKVIIYAICDFDFVYYLTTLGNVYISGRFNNYAANNRVAVSFEDLDWFYQYSVYACVVMPSNSYAVVVCCRINTLECFTKSYNAVMQTGREISHYFSKHTRTSDIGSLIDSWNKVRQRYQWPIYSKLAKYIKTSDIGSLHKSKASAHK